MNMFDTLVVDIRMRKYSKKFCYKFHTLVPSLSIFANLLTVYFDMFHLPCQILVRPKMESPMFLPMYFILWFTEEGESVMDLFAGYIFCIHSYINVCIL